MFTKARIKLTGWYLLIIMLISISFSVAIYNTLTSELNRVEQAQRLRLERQTPSGFREPMMRQRAIDPEIIAETRDRVKVMLLIINLAILSLSAFASYFLAGRTLNPIKKMVDEQNRFIADASHELKTPLTSIKSEIEVFLRDKKTTLKEAKILLSSNLEEVNKLQILTDSLLMSAKISRARNNFEKIKLNDITDDAVSKLKGLSKQKGVVISKNISNIYLDGDRKSLTELLVILLDNSIKYSNNNSSVNITAKQSGNNVSISVQDFGTGIPEDDLPFVTERFFRVDKSRTKTNVPGFGLGLSIAKIIVEKHNGSFKIDSILDKGTTVTINLPINHI
jgi:two-component system, OmpR family, sensor histidine kinase CiaH